MADVVAMPTVIPPTRSLATPADVGRACPYCRFAFKPQTEVMICGACSACHHDDCWADNGGCAVMGCAAAPGGPADGAAADADRAVAMAPPVALGAQPTIARRPAASAPSTVAIPRQRSSAGSVAGAPASPPSAPAAPGRGLSPLIAVIIGLLVIGGTVGGVLALRGHSPSSSRVTRTVVARDPGTSSTSTPSAPTSPQPADAAAARRAVVSQLRRYEAAFTDRSLGEMRSLLAPDVTRHGLATGGCEDRTGRAHVLTAYSENFAVSEDAGRYELRGLRPNGVTVTGDSAKTTVGYHIVRGNTGVISFGLQRAGDGGWLISHIDSHCH